VAEVVFDVCVNVDSVCCRQTNTVEWACVGCKRTEAKPMELPEADLVEWHGGDGLMLCTHGNLKKRYRSGEESLRIGALHEKCNIVESWEIAPPHSKFPQLESTTSL